MRSNYKRLGDYIKVVNKRNKKLEVETLLGVSIRKVLMPSIANTIGTNMTTYKIIKRNQFAYGPVTSRNGDKISIAILDEYDEAIVSQAYTVFKIIDENALSPEYLMMWFRRPEFDRYARYKSHGSAREIFGWDEMLETELPIPSIEIQQEIVNEYQTITKRIQLNEQLNQKLEETAQALYKHWFVDFEFPNENGEPYKSSGGAMVFNEELDGEVPEGWELNEINYFCDIGSSKRIFQSEYINSGIPFYRGKEISLKKAGKPITDLLFISEDRYQDLKSKYGKPELGDILLTAVGTIGASYRVADEEFYFKDGNIIWFKNFRKKDYGSFIYALMQSNIFDDIIANITIGSTQKAITINALGITRILKPNDNLISKFAQMLDVLNLKNSTKNAISLRLIDLNNLLLSKMATVGSEN